MSENYDPLNQRSLVLHLLDLPADDNVVAHIEHRDPGFLARVIKPGELADFLGITPGALAQLRHRGEGGPPWIQVTEKSVGYLMRDVVEWLRQNRRFRVAA